MTEHLDSLNANDLDTESAWEAEIQRRIAELGHGVVKPIPWSQARQLIFGDAGDSADF